MTYPISKIEVWEPGAGSALYIITDKQISLYSKEVVTDAIGNFSFAVPTKKNGSYEYTDIDLFDKVKIWYGYNSLEGDPIFVGRIGKISAPLSVQGGYIRQISGLSQGEILLRRFKKNKYYNAIAASTIVTDWATDLSLGTGNITADATSVTLEVRTKSYFDLLRFISDYWASAGSQIKKDFYVNVDNDLVWKTRPFRTAGVDSFTVGQNIIHYAVTRKSDQIKNEIAVYGSAEKPVPADKDSWTDSLTDWSASAGTLYLGTPPIVGTYTIRCYTGAGAATTTFKRVIPRQTIRNISTVSFWKQFYGVISSAKFRLLAPDTSNYFEADLGTTGGGTQEFKSFGLGPNQEYDAASNPNGVWTKVGSPNWWDIQGIQFHVVHTTNDWNDHIDGFYFYAERWESTANDATSQTNYGQRDLEVTDDKLHSDSDCQKRAETLLYQLKDPPTQIELTVPGNTNLLVGDRLQMTIAAEGIDAVSYDVISVEHAFSVSGFMTKAILVNTANIRQAISTKPIQVMADLHRFFRKFALDEKELR